MISIIIPCYWANEELVSITIKCLNSLNDTTDNEPQQVLVIDDGSPLKEEFVDNTDFIQQIETIKRERNGGYAAAVNTGLFYAKGNILIICNNDIEFLQPDWLDHLLYPIKNDQADISLIRQTDTDGWNTDTKYTYNDKFGALWAMTREAYEKLGPMDERFGKGLFEDLDYWRRAQDAGLTIIKNHAGLVEHKGKATFKEVDPDDKQFMKNMFIYKEKWGDKAYIYEPEPNKILLIDEYELTERTQPEVINKSVSLEEAERRWGRIW